MELLHSLTLGDIARENRRSRPLSTAVVDGAVRLTYEQLDDRVDRLAQALAAQGVGAGDRVLWVGRNSFRVLESLLAAARIGAVFCPVNWRQSRAELEFVLKDFAPRVVLWEGVDDTVAAARESAAPETLWARADGGEWDNTYERWLARPADAPSRRSTSIRPRHVWRSTPQPSPASPTLHCSATRPSSPTTCPSP